MDKTKLKSKLLIFDKKIICWISARKKKSITIIFSYVFQDLNLLFQMAHLDTLHDTINHLLPYNTWLKKKSNLILHPLLVTLTSRSFYRLLSNRLPVIHLSISVFDFHVHRTKENTIAAYKAYKGAREWMNAPTRLPAAKN